MQRTKLVAVLVVVGAFAAGAAIGVAGDRAFRAQDKLLLPSEPREFWNQVENEWGLSASQRKVMDSLMDAQHLKMVALYKPIRPSLDSINTVARDVSDSTLAQLRLVLTPDQQTKLDRLRDEMRRRDAERRARRDSDLAKIR